MPLIDKSRQIQVIQYKSWKIAGIGGISREWRAPSAGRPRASSYRSQYPRFYKYSLSRGHSQAGLSTWRRLASFCALSRHPRTSSPPRWRLVPPPPLPPAQPYAPSLPLSLPPPPHPPILFSCPLFCLLSPVFLYTMTAMSRFDRIFFWERAL